MDHDIIVVGAGPAGLCIARPQADGEHEQKWHLAATFALRR